MQYYRLYSLIVKRIEWISKVHWTIFQEPTLKNIITPLLKKWVSQKNQ